MISILLFLITALLLYIYLGYPLVLGVMAHLFPRTHRQDEQNRPSVTLIVSAHNEEKVIPAKLENSLSLDYPREKLKVVVVSDASTDRTDEIVSVWNDPRVRLVRMEPRRGKTAGLNAALGQIDTDIVVFSDANAIYHPSAIGKLVRHFADESVGYVVGQARYEDRRATAAGKSEGTYWNFETRLKQWESDFSSVVGGDGAIYAIRRDLYAPLKETDINDFVNPLQIVAEGYRGIFDPEAICFESPAGDFQKEFGRKVRIANRSFNGLLRVPDACNPFLTGRFAWQVISHKLLRWLSPYFLACHFLLTLLSPREGWGGAVAMGFSLCYGIGGILALEGYRQDRNGKPGSRLFYLPYYLCLMNIASAVGIWLRIRGRTITTWDTVREERGREYRIVLVLPLLFLLGGLGVSLRLAGWYGWERQWAMGGAYLLCLLLLYTYLGYPAVLGILTRFRRIEVDRDDTYLPPVVLVISAYNEEAVIEEKLENSLALEYPTERLRILVVSDGSTDRTNAIAEGFSEQGIELFAYIPNTGKMSALRRVLNEISSEVVVFSDANVMYEPDALRKLVRNFHDSRVGAVSGRVILINNNISYGKAESRYYDIEHYIQQKEGETGAMMGADGAMYAIRQKLFRPPSADTILDDFVISMKVVEQGYWLVHEEEAVGYEKNVQEVRAEIGRKARIIAGGIQCLLRGEGIPRVSPPFLFFKFVSHKVLRWFSGALLVTLLYLLLYLRFIGADLGPVLTLVSYGLVGGLGVASLGTILPVCRKFEALNLVHYFFMLNLASLAGCYRGFTGRQKVTWRCP